MGHEPITKYIVAAVVTLQIVVAFLLRNTIPFSPLFLFVAYAVGGTANHNLFLAIHEITHNLAFKGINANKYLALFANLPIGLPYAMMFKVSRPMVNAGLAQFMTNRFTKRNTTSTITNSLAKTASTLISLPV